MDVEALWDLLGEDMDKKEFGLFKKVDSKKWHQNTSQLCTFWFKHLVGHELYLPLRFPFNLSSVLMIEMVEGTKWNQSQFWALADFYQNIVDKTIFRYYIHMDVEALWDVFSDPVHFKIAAFKNVDSK